LSARTTALKSAGILTSRRPPPQRLRLVIHASTRTANVTGANYVIDGGLITTT
jgi:hypothetical protein